jgi:TPR repeat protein
MPFPAVARMTRRAAYFAVAYAFLASVSRSLNASAQQNQTYDLGSFDRQTGCVYASVVVTAGPGGAGTNFTVECGGDDPQTLAWQCHFNRSDFVGPAYTLTDVTVLGLSSATPYSQRCTGDLTVDPLDSIHTANQDVAEKLAAFINSNLFSGSRPAPVSAKPVKNVEQSLTCAKRSAQTGPIRAWVEQGNSGDCVLFLKDTGAYPVAVDDVNIFNCVNVALGCNRSHFALHETVIRFGDPHLGYPYGLQIPVSPASCMTGCNGNQVRFSWSIAYTNVTPTALQNLGSAYLYGKGVKQDYKKALDYLRQAASSGSADADVDLGYMYEFGLGTPIDRNAAFRYYLRAAERNVPAALNHVGGSYLLGIGTSKNIGRAIEYLTKAANAGFPYAWDRLGNIYEYGNGVPTNYVAAVGDFRRGSAAGNADSEADLGYMYAAGNGVPRDYGAAMIWFQKAAAQGNPYGVANVANFYARGLGAAGTGDNVQQLANLRSTVGKTGGYSEEVMGWIYEHGLLGLSVDLPTAFTWYTKGAQQGNNLARTQLPILLAEVAPTADQWLNDHVEGAETQYDDANNGAMTLRVTTFKVNNCILSYEDTFDTTSSSAPPGNHTLQLNLATAMDPPLGSMNKENAIGESSIAYYGPSLRALSGNLPLFQNGHPDLPYRYHVVPLPNLALAQAATFYLTASIHSCKAQPAKST